MDESNRRIWDADANNFQPRFGFTYATPTTIVRGGAGSSFRRFRSTRCPGLGNPVNQLGFARQTPIPVSSDNGLTFQANLTNPVPAASSCNRMARAWGCAPTWEPASARGRRRASSRPIASTPRILAVQPRRRASTRTDWLVELSYLGQKGSHVPIVEQLNYVPQQIRTSSPLRDNAAETFLSQVVSNPFQGLTPAPGSNGATVARRRCFCSIRISTT